MKKQYDYRIIFTSLKKLKKEEKNKYVFETIKEVTSLEPAIEELRKIINDGNNENWIGYTRT